jgi:ketosteroid isomerase-like protein
MLAMSFSNHAQGSPAEDARTVAALDTKFQAAVKADDVAALEEILADDHCLVTGRGHSFDKKAELDDARSHDTVYEQQDELPGTQTVRVRDDTAVVTALLWIKGVRAGKPIDYKLWFSDVYVRTPQGWRYFVGQASLPLPPGPTK